MFNLKFSLFFKFHYNSADADMPAVAPDFDTENDDTEEVIIREGDPVVIVGGSIEYYGMLLEAYPETKRGLVRFWHPIWMEWINSGFDAHRIVLLEDQFAVKAVQS